MNQVMDETIETAILVRVCLNSFNAFQLTGEPTRWMSSLMSMWMTWTDQVKTVYGSEDTRRGACGFPLEVNSPSIVFSWSVDTNISPTADLSTALGSASNKDRFWLFRTFSRRLTRSHSGRTEIRNSHIISQHGFSEYRWPL